MLAFLVSNGAGSLASRLAGSLALAASALSSGLFQIALIQRLNVFHRETLLFISIWEPFPASAGYLKRSPVRINPLADPSRLNMMSLSGFNGRASRAACFRHSSDPDRHSR